MKRSQFITGVFKRIVFIPIFILWSSLILIILPIGCLLYWLFTGNDGNDFIDWWCEDFYARIREALLE